MANRSQSDRTTPKETDEAVEMPHSRVEVRQGDRARLPMRVLYISIFLAVAVLFALYLTFATR